MRLTATSRIAGMAVAFVGAAVLAGWLLHIEPLKGLHSSLATMKPNTALAFLLAGVALALLASPGPDRRMLRLGQGCALAVALVATLTLAEYAGGWDFGIDELLVADTRHGLAASFPGRMGVNTALSFLLARAVRSVSSLPTVAMILLTSWLQPGIGTTAREVGIAECLPKPICASRSLARRGQGASRRCWRASGNPWPVYGSTPLAAVG